MRIWRRVSWRHPFYTSPYIKTTMWLWKKQTRAEWLLCTMGELHACAPAAAGWASKKLVKWLAPKMWLAEKPVCLELADIEEACESYATQEVCGGATWRGDGTAQFDVTNRHQQIRMDGPLAIIFDVHEDGTIWGKGTATLTFAVKYYFEGGTDPGQCTGNGRGRVSLTVSGMNEDGKLKLILETSAKKNYITTASCSGSFSPINAWFRTSDLGAAGGIQELYTDILFFDQNEHLVVVMEDGAEGQFVEDLSEPATHATGISTVWRRIFSIRLKSLPDHR